VNAPRCRGPKWKFRVKGASTHKLPRPREFVLTRDGGGHMWFVQR
jgi:hypothetical protein